MLFNRLAAFSGFAGLAVTLFAVAPASAVTMAECSTKHNAAKDAGTLGGKNWNEFRKAECSSDSTAAVSSDNKDKKTVDAGKKPAETDAAATADAQPAKKLTMKECSTKYNAAKDAGTLGGKNWNAFRKAECGAGAANDDSAPSLRQAKYTGEPETPTINAPNSVQFPQSISKKFASETPAKARMHTCLEQYYANKDGNTLGGLRWIQKGGGFYSLCNAKLKANLAG